jgi:aspartate 1-decarboxylase
MKRQIFKSKIHRATVTKADLDYEGSITIDSYLLAAANIIPYELVHIWNVTNGNRLVTYALSGIERSGEICINGAGAKLCEVGDIVIIATFAEMKNKKAKLWVPTVVKVDSENKIIETPWVYSLDNLLK